MHIATSRLVAFALLTATVLSPVGARVVQASEPWKTYPAGDVLSIEFEREMCEGTCPAYLVVLRSDGTLTYRGYSSVNHMGTWTAKFWAQDFGRLVALLKKEGFDSLRAEYNVPVPDMPNQIVTVRHKTRTKRVTEYGPDSTIQLWSIQESIDGVVSYATDWKRVPDLKPTKKSKK
jgi:hypothetical protein